MDIKSALVKLGRSILIAFGLIGVVQVGFEKPDLRARGDGSVLVSTRLSGAVTEEMAPLVENSVPVHLTLTAELYSASGTRTIIESSRSLVYRSIDKLFVVSGDGRADERVYPNLESAVSELERFEFLIKEGRFDTIIFRGTLELPTMGDERIVKDLWRGKDPTLVFSLDGR